MAGDFLAMGGYAFYVWLAYGLSALVLIVNAVLPGRREKTLLARIAKRAREKQNAQ
jgi:heme exporter protein D